MSETTTAWQPNPPQEGEFAQATASAIADPSGVALIDPSSVAIIDTGQTFTQITTSWLDDPGL